MDNQTGTPRQPKNRFWFRVGLSAIALFILIVLWQQHSRSGVIIDRGVSRLQRDVSALTSAIRKYKADTGHFPKVPTLSSGELDNGSLIAILTGTSTNPPQTIAYLNVAPSLLLNGNFVDPWKHPYHVIINDDGSGELRIQNKVISTDVAVWSDGRNGVNEFGDGDDVRGW